MTYKKRCSSCIHILCDVVGRQRPERNMEFMCESISLFEKCYGFEYKEETRELALDAISKYGPSTPWENDERMLPIYRILGKYSRSMSSTDLYDKLHEKGLYATSAAFHVDWAEVHLLANQVEKARAILTLMEQAVGPDHASCVQLRRRVVLEENRVAEQPQASRTSKIAALVNPMEAPNHSARRNLFGSTSPESLKTNLPAEPIVDDPMCKSPSEPTQPILPPSRDESIVLPNIGDAPPIDISIVSPSINLMQSGQIPPNFSLPPVFSFSNAIPTSTNTYKPSMHTTTRETTMIRNSIMSTSIMPHMLSGLPSHPGQIGNGQFAVPSLPTFRELARSQNANAENQDPRGALASQHSTARRDLAGVLMPSKNFELDPFGELELEKKPISAYELKKARLQNQAQNPHHSAARRIFPDSTQQLSSAFSSFGLAPSSSKQ